MRMVMLLAVGGIMVALAANWLPNPLGGALSGLAFFLLGLVLTYWRAIGRWPVLLIKAARILMDQEDHPEKYVMPYVDSVELWPERYKRTPDICREGADCRGKAAR